MIVPTPSDHRLADFRRQDLLAEAARVRLVDAARQSPHDVFVTTIKPRLGLTHAFARAVRSAIASVA
jgi:hypothetical protein